MTAKSATRKSAIVGAAATALFAAVPAFADGPAAEASLQAAIRNILRTPATNTIAAATGNQPRFSAIDIGNSDDISVGPDETAIGHAETGEDVNVVNSGNLTGGIGIEVSTGAINLADFIADQSSVTHYDDQPFRYAPLYDDAGNLVEEFVVTGIRTIDGGDLVLNTDPLASRISITNSGSIAFSGSEGISATNKAGESITIANSGDIASTQDTEGRVGIYANTETYQVTFDETQLDAGEFTYNSNGQLTGVIRPENWDVDALRVDMAYDGGTINIHNTGDIDMGDVGALAVWGEVHSAGIYARGDGGTTVNNEGDIKVGRGSFGIRTVSQGNVSITNSGRIDTGNTSAGISVWRSNGNVDDYRLSGDTYVLNSGDIFGGIARDEAETGEQVAVFGVHVVVPGSTNEYIAGTLRSNQLAAEYNQILGYDYFPTYEVPNVHLFETNTINRGHIELKDGAIGIFVDALSGYSTAVNEGTIIVGDGNADTQSVQQLASAGIMQDNLPHPGSSAVMVSINAETGIIVTGDNGIGIANDSNTGDSFVINEGSISTGNGVVGPHSYGGETYDLLFTSKGLFSRSFADVLGSTAYTRNSGSITVGELAIGSETVGNGNALVDPTRLTAINFNEGSITTGDNSIGMAAAGRNTSILNTGTVTTGDFDTSAYTGGEYTAFSFEQLRAGVMASAWRYAEVVNYGSITVGDNKIGAVARSANAGLGYTSSVVQGDTGVITTGDHAIGARVESNLFSFFASAGEISVGDDSIGVEMTSGTAFAYIYDNHPTTFPGVVQAINSGIIETGDNSTGIRMNGVREVPWEAYIRQEDPNNPGYYHNVYYSGTAEVTSSSYLNNAGTIRVGANSTGVEIAGTGGNEDGLQLFNSGTIDGSEAGSTALRINADRNLDSSTINVGTIEGGITFGAGDDKLINTLMIDNAGRVTHSGNIVMNGSTIDFGAGTNSFENDRGTITIAGGDNLITGADVVMNAAHVEARNGAVDSTLTLDGNLSGDFTFGTDVAGSSADQLIITGDVSEDSSMSVVINTTEQLKGANSFKVITVGGENHGTTVVAGVTGDFADSLLDAEVNYSEATGEVSVTAHFGMGHMATSVSAATGMAQHWWMQSIGSLDKRDMLQLAGQSDAGVSAWASVFQEEGSVDPTNDLQDVSFDQKLSGLQGGIEWKGDVGGGTFSVGPMFSYGSASSSQNANLANAKGDATAYGLTAGFRFSNGLYVNAAWQQMAMAIDFRTPDTLSNATGSTDAEGDGFDVELGYAHKLGSGLTLAPQLQYASVTVDLDDFKSSDEVYALSDLRGKHSLLRAGLSVFKTFETTHGSITPLADFSYLDVMDGDSALSSNGIEFGNDTTGSGYRAEFGVAARYKGWDITGRLGLADTAAIKSALSTNLTVRYHW